MTIHSDLTTIQNCIGNRLDDATIGDRRIAGVIGDAPSHYSKSPALWNAAFDDLAMNAIYLPFDVDASHLRNFVSALRNSDRVMGINVTVPHKVQIMDFLDELDPSAERVQAVNTVVKTSARPADRPQHRRRRLRPKHPRGATGTGSSLYQIA